MVQMRGLGDVGLGGGGGVGGVVSQQCPPPPRSPSAPSSQIPALS